jgi:hypothetical protein
MSVPNDKASGDQLDATEVNTLRDIGFIVSLLAGETLAGATLPVPVYDSASDGKLYACDGNDQSKQEFIGFVISSASSGAAIQLQMTGIVSGFSGLTVGAKYYVQDTVGTIGTSMGTYECLVGIAVSATQILITRGEDQYVGSQSIADGSNTITSAVQGIWKKIIILASGNNGANTGEIILYRKGKTSGTFIVNEGSAPNFALGYSASVSGTTISVSAQGNSATVSGTAYYFR